MEDLSKMLQTPMTGLETVQWKSRLVSLARKYGDYRPLGSRHFSTFIKQGKTLLVTFETVQGIRSLSETAQPFGFDMVKSEGWSHLCLISQGDTWFRDPRVYAYFDELIDNEFFEDFDQVLFYGAGPCGYAAAAFSVSAPGATVVAVQPQATLDPRMTEWDPRFVEMRRTSFTDRFGYAPDMLDGAQRAFVLYDPSEELDAMHSALFARSNVTRFRMRNMGGALQTRLLEMDILYEILKLANSGRLSERAFSNLYRARRDNNSYLRALMGRLDKDDRPYLNTLLCRNVTRRHEAAKFRRKLEILEGRASAGEFDLPGERA
ncbi:phosphoadenosine phosphosulfate reductase [Arenibacterium sp. CAU 1754]